MSNIRIRFLTIVLVTASILSGLSMPPAMAQDAYGTRTVTDCHGNTSTFTAPPERIATITTNVVEFLIAMGLQDRIIGTQAAAPGAYPSDIQTVADTIPKLGGEYVPGAFVPVQKEDLLAAEPDFVIGGWPSNFDASLGAFTQEELNERDIPNYFSLTAWCDRTAPVDDLSVVYQEIENYGTIFDDEAAAQTLIDQIQAPVDEVQKAVAGLDQPKVFSYSWEDGQGQAYAMGNQHLGNAIVQLAGGQNIFSNVDAVFGEVSWEDVIAANPDYIVLEVFGKATQEEFDQTVEQAKEFFASDPALQNITAVKEGNFIPIVAQSYYVGSVRNGEAVEQIARVLHPDAFQE